MASKLDYLWVGLGSAVGGVGRYWVSGWMAEHFGERFPFGTLFVNVTGSFAIGFLAAFAVAEGRFWLAPASRLFLLMGLLGGFTTFSSFSLQTLNLAREGQWLQAGANVAGSVVACLIAVWLGHLVGQALNR